MNKLLKISNALGRNISQLKQEYWPLLAVYFAYGFSSFLHIAQMFWFKEELSLSVVEIVEITFWINLPWSSKILFSQFIDTYRIAGSKRTAYIVLGAIVMMVGFVILAAMANNWWQIRDYLSDYTLLVVSGICIRFGLVMQDLVADTLCLEVVDHSQPSYKQEIAKVQIFATAARAVGGIIGVGIGSYLAEFYSYRYLVMLEFLVPIISIIGILVISENDQQHNKDNQFSIPIFIIAICYVLIIILLGISDLPLKQETIFMIGVALHLILIYHYTSDMPKKMQHAIFVIIWVVFSFRVMPSYGEGIKWWKMDVLGFNPQFFGLLAQLTKIFSFIGLWLFMRYHRYTTLARGLLFISLFYIIFELPLIGMSLGLHQWTTVHLGLDAKDLMIIDITGDGLTFFLIKTCYNIAVAEYAPKQNRTTWFAMTASLMSVAFSLGNKVTTKWMNNLYIIERGMYENAADLIMVVFLLRALIPTLAIIVLMKPWRAKAQELKP
ncbi:MAG: hypothetical protein AAF153_02290 [Pseudomonadota bacterium]